MTEQPWHLYWVPYAIDMAQTVLQSSGDPLPAAAKHTYKAVLKLWVRPSTPVLGSREPFTVVEKCEVIASSEEEAEQQLRAKQFSNAFGDQMSLKEIVSVGPK